MQAKTDRMAEVAGSVGLRINKGKRKILKINTNNLDPITLGNEPFEEVTNFTYIGSVVDDWGDQTGILRFVLVRPGQLSRG